MLFNTYSFILCFLIPVVLFYRFVPDAFRVWYLILVSVLFYAQWDRWHLFVLGGSVVVNYLFAYFIYVRGLMGGRILKRGMLFLLIGFDVGLLGYFKYSGFLNLSEGDVVLPLAISFFTFQQIAYVVDIYRGRIVLESFQRYLFFVMFFPQLVAGPIVHYSYVMKQVPKAFASGSSFISKLSLESGGFDAGVMLFSMGLFSKVVLADSLIEQSYRSWSDIFAYSFMIYFDFSGYANMAVGLALMFGIVLPFNFDSPYRARNLMEFWRRWHITLSDFLKEHIYIPLGGNRFGQNRQVLALMSTMIVAGVWHGAGWNFLLWGVMHGVGLVVLHLFDVKVPKILGIVFTFLYVSLLWVLFFSGSIDEALIIYKGLFEFDGFGARGYDVVWLLGCAVVVWVMPNSMQIIDTKKSDFGMKSWYAYVGAILFFVSLKFMAESPSISFVYFNF